MALLRNLFLAMLFAFGAAADVWAQGGLRTVVIDPGHGGEDPGTVRGKIYEKDIALDVALLLGGMIKERMPDVKVVYTRTKDVKVGLPQRAKTANDAKADLFLSIHVNATDAKEGPSGALTLIMGRENEGGNLDMAMRENDVIVYEDDYKTTYAEYLSGSPEMFIIYSLMQHANIEKSIRFAALVQGRFKAASPMPDRGLRRQKLLVLWHSTMPGVLVELGFMNNAHDRGVLTSDDGKRRMAAAMLDAICEYNGGTVAAATTTTTTTTTKPETQKVPARADAEGGVIYKVQILSTTKKAARRELKDYADSAEERREDGRYRYYVGCCTRYAEGMELQTDVRRTFAGAFLVAFRDGRRISVSEARAAE